MKTKFKYYLAGWFILLAIFNVIIFATPNEWYGFNKFGGAFWGSYICITIAFVGQLVCAAKAFQAGNATKLFYNIPLITISYTALLLMMVVGSVCFVVPNLPNWIAIVVAVIILGFSAISVVKAQAAADIVSEMDEKIKIKTFTIKSLITDAESLLREAKTEQIKLDVKRVYEALRYADPMSNDALKDDELRITKKFKELSDAVISVDEEMTKDISEDLLLLIASRNGKCKMLK